ncbi:hypothetical protein AQUCO_02600047v1 [Aquilegia coerulea]|uniref:RING-type E3 ubiquitin transferase n=1 Tax=Aquilegia coerulea TaxID=218851 RepID=A0A2G5D738_AQUCA|nr:hypothetical protein AQUCO_02600047v1 [Aquilegia coerulea]
MLLDGKFGPGGGLFCCITAAGFYLLACSYKSEKEYLQFITKIDQLKDLSLKALPLLVAVSGRVGSDTPIKCKRSDSKCVILKEREDGTGRVHVVGAEGASELDLTFASKIFEAPDESLLHEISNECFTCKTDLSIKRMEVVLPIGELLTAIGEAVKDKNGAIQIQRPHTGKFYLTQKSIDCLISDLGSCQSIFKCFSVGFTVFGVILIAEHLINKVMERRLRSDLRQSGVSAAAQRLEQDNDGLNGRTSNESESENDGLVRDLCVVCEDQSTTWHLSHKHLATLTL